MARRLALALAGALLLGAPGAAAHAQNPPVTTVDVQGVRLLCAHQTSQATSALADDHNARAKVVVTGHSHKASVTVKEGRLWINPGGAGPKRFSNLRAAGLLEVRPKELVARLYSLEDEALPLIAEARLGWD